MTIIRITIRITIMTITIKSWQEQGASLGGVGGEELEQDWQQDISMMRAVAAAIALALVMASRVKVVAGAQQ